MTTIALYHKHYDKKHLEEVKAEMLKLGAPQIRAIWSEVYGIWMAVEGCHRLRAAHELGLTPVIIDVTNEDTITIQNRDGDVMVNVMDEAIELTDNITKTQLLDF
jgi:hypothetical protein